MAPLEEDSPMDFAELLPPDDLILDSEADQGDRGGRSARSASLGLPP